MLKPLKDVDIVCLLPAYRWELLHGPDGPAKAMESFEAPIEDRWPDVQFDVGDDYVLMGDREQNRRELFVGMTRARDGLWLGYLEQ